MFRLRSVISAACLAVILAGCTDGSDGNGGAVVYDFTGIDAAFQEFIDEHPVLDGISTTLVDATDGTVHEAAFGDHTLETVVLLASTSKMPTATLMMALDDDESLNFDVAASIDNYLPWMGVYGDRTVTQLVSNTSGIPGLSGLASYGPHMCQFTPTATLQGCAEILYTVMVPGTVPPGTAFSYGGSQWQLAGAVAEHVTNSTWAQAFDRYIAEPCELEVFRYGNPWSDIGAFDGSPDSLIGLQNPHMEGGAISNMRDYAKILLMHLRGGRCGDTQVISADSVAYMQVNRAGDFGVDYGMGWWIGQSGDPASTIYYDPGFFGAISWIDPGRGIGGYVAIDEYENDASGAVYDLVLNTIIPLQQALVDAARAGG